MRKDAFSLAMVVFVLLMKDEHVFLIRRAHTGYADGLYTLPGGHVHQGESLRDAAVREAKEEVGVDFQVEDLSYVHALYRPKGERAFLASCFVVSKWEGTARNAEPEAADAAAWFPLHALPEEGMLPYVSHLLEGVKQGQFLSEYRD